MHANSEAKPGKQTAASPTLHSTFPFLICLGFEFSHFLQFQHCTRFSRRTIVTSAATALQELNTHAVVSQHSDPPAQRLLGTLRSCVNMGRISFTTLQKDFSSPFITLAVKSRCGTRTSYSGNFRFRIPSPFGTPCALGVSDVSLSAVRNFEATNRKGGAMAKNDRLRGKRRGALTLEWILLVTVLVIGIIGGMAAVRNATNAELLDLANAISAINVGGS